MEETQASGTPPFVYHARCCSEGVRGAAAPGPGTGTDALTAPREDGWIIRSVNGMSLNIDQKDGMI